MKHRERRFVAEYLVHADPAEAARRSGYAPRMAQRVGTAMLRKAPVRFAIAARQSERAARLGLSRERVLREYARIAFADLGGVASWRNGDFTMVPLGELGDDEAAAIQYVALTPKGRVRRVHFHDKDLAVKALAQYFGIDAAAPRPEPANGARERLLLLIERVVKA